MEKQLRREQENPAFSRVYTLTWCRETDTHTIQHPRGRLDPARSTTLSPWKHPFPPAVWGLGGDRLLDVVITRREGSLRTTLGQTRASAFSSALLSLGYWY